jgi:hypothetical protein
MNETPSVKTRNSKNSGLKVRAGRAEDDRRPTRREIPKGFGLMVTLSLMILLVVVAMGLLGLSAVALRSSSQEQAMAQARSNARMETNGQGTPDYAAEKQNRFQAWLVSDTDASAVRNRSYQGHAEDCRFGCLLLSLALDPEPGIIRPPHSAEPWPSRASSPSPSVRRWPACSRRPAHGMRRWAA